MDLVQYVVWLSHDSWFSSHDSQRMNCFSHVYRLYTIIASKVHVAMMVDSGERHFECVDVEEG